MNQTSFTYDPTTGDLLQVIDPSGNLVQYTYDAFGRLTSLTDSNGQVTVFEYDVLGRLTYFGVERTSSTAQSLSTQSSSVGPASEPSYTPLIWDALASRYSEEEEDQKSTEEQPVVFLVN